LLRSAAREDAELRAEHLALQVEDTEAALSGAKEAARVTSQAVVAGRTAVSAFRDRALNAEQQIHELTKLLVRHGGAPLRLPIVEPYCPSDLSCWR
jgi:hypothetical protein